MYFSLLGTVAGNLALTLNARGGIYLAGGILPQFADTLAISDFRKRFENKGQFQAFLSTIPSFVIIHPYPGLVGARNYANVHLGEA
jgi:glucokinase